MTILLLAKADPELKGHQPLWALQGGNSPELKAKALEILKGYSVNSDVSWTELVEEYAEELFPGLSWCASDVYFYSIPDGIEFQVLRDSFGNEIAVYFDGVSSLQNICFAKEITLEELQALL